ncbi:DUF2630 family protein [Streptomyces fuscichromogenes]|uniref:DUF2630 family protein n=1 Tax=Streptomyces fuscichromogenes TaxID=1324013 RepID=A0A918CTK1_9ACTN|nr:DUF2630 family protein [Streptomyces fuscichromogenes]GGN21586.1 hypothetical protein GCM10011578_052800 [Streptomyces fuscichromogenes]
MTGPESEAEKEILGRITEMISQEKDLRDRMAQQEIDGTTEHALLARLETELDQCWDLLRQRRARAAVGQDPGEANVRPASQVEGYLS